MSFVIDHVRRIDAQLDRVQLSEIPSSTAQVQGYGLTEEDYRDPAVSARIAHLQSLIKSLSSASSSKTPLVSIRRILKALDHARTFAGADSWDGRHEQRETADTEAGHTTINYEHELSWLLLSKATVQAYGHILNAILEQTIPLSDDIWYWDDVLSSYRYAGIYSIQTSPLRLWGWSKTIYYDVRARGGAVAEDWQRFYGLVRQVVKERSVADIRRRVISPLALVRSEARRKQAHLKQMRYVNANALGVLLGEGLGNESVHDDELRSPVEGFSSQQLRQKWKSTVAKSIVLMEVVLANVNKEDLTADKFDDAVATASQDDPYYEIHAQNGDKVATSLKPSAVAERLHNLLSDRLPEYKSGFNTMVKKHGKPPVIVRYWLPVSILLISSSTILRILVNRKEEIITWIREFGATVIDFWRNWVVEPAKKVIGTIRHDEGSEVSIMSKRSLEGDRESLERMVVDFAASHPDGKPLSEVELAEVRAKVREGDLTPVLKAYEKDMEKPILGAIKGNLIRTLLIQVQKTKVDVEVAMSGIDSILKSQELLFGFIGLTPGVLVSIAVWRWVSGVLTNRKGLKVGSRRGQLLRILRNIDRILVTATPTEFGELSYKDHGLLLCEVHLLRQTAAEILPKKVFHDLVEDLDDLVDVRTGIDRQLKVVERVRWAYSRWIH